MGARTAERALPPIAHASVWGSRACSSVDVSTSGRGGKGSDDVIILLSDETAASEAAPLISHNAAKLAFCGGASGALAKTCTAPLARLTILYQVRALSVVGPGAAGQQLGVIPALRHIIATEGLCSLWKGNLVTIMHRIPYSATNFWTYEATKKALQGRLGNEAVRAWAAGALSGLVACTAAYPLDLLRTRIAAQTERAGAEQPYRRLPCALRRILAEQGARGLYKGLGATLVQVVPGLAFNFCFYDSFKRLALQQQEAHQARQAAQQQAEQQTRPQGPQCQRRADAAGPGPGSGMQAHGRPSSAPCSRPPAPPPPSPLTSAACACAAGLCTSTLTFPLDVVRRRLQVYERGALGRLRYGDVVRAVYAEGGLKAFYRGIGPEYAKVLPGMAIAFTTYEALKRLTGASA